MAEEQTVRICCQVPIGLANEMKEIAAAMGSTRAEFYRTCMVAGFFEIAEKYNKVLVNRKLRKTNER